MPSTNGTPGTRRLVRLHLPPRDERSASDAPPLRLAAEESVPRSSQTDDVLAALNSVSRRIEDLARELNCLGYFDDGDHDRPRAA